MFALIVVLYCLDDYTFIVILKFIEMNLVLSGNMYFPGIQ